MIQVPGCRWRACSGRQESAADGWNEATPGLLPHERCIVAEQVRPANRSERARTSRKMCQLEVKINCAAACKFDCCQTDRVRESEADGSPSVGGGRFGLLAPTADLRHFGSRTLETVTLLWCWFLVVACVATALLDASTSAAFFVLLGFEMGGGGCFCCLEHRSFVLGDLFHCCDLITSQTTLPTKKTANQRTESMVVCNRS